MPHCVNPPRATFCHITPSPVLFCGCQISHTNTHIRAHTRTHWPQRRPFYAEWGQAPWISCLAPDLFFLTLASHSLRFCILLSLITPSQVCSLLQTKNQNKKTQQKQPGRTTLLSLSLFSSSQETKTNLMEKLKFFFICFFFFQIQGTMSINIPICLSVFTPRFSVRTSRHVSYWTVCSYAAPYSFTSLLSEL